MGPSEGLEAVVLGPGDIAGGVALSDAAGWNQVADDWAFFIAQGHASGFRSPIDGLVATTAAVVYGGTAWLGMVLVAQAWRHRGLASLLLERTLRRLEALHVTVALDATPAGEPVYRHLGFRTGFVFERWEGTGAPGVDAPLDPAPRAAGRDELDRIVALDQAATRLGRRSLLQNIWQRVDTRAWMAADGEGFVLVRAGHRATQIGPLVARSTEQARALLAAALRGTNGRVFLDVPSARTDLADWLTAHGYVRQRPFVRMALGRAPLPLDDRQFVLAGPEFG